MSANKSYLVANKGNENFLITGKSCDLINELRKKKKPQTYEQLEQSLACPRQSLYVFVNRLAKSNLIEKQVNNDGVSISLVDSVDFVKCKVIH